MLYITLGSHDKCTRNSKEWSSYASRVYSPMMSNFPTFGQDISLIRLQNFAPINEFISPICLPEINGKSLRIDVNSYQTNLMNIYSQHNISHFRVKYIRQ